jgi:hypothetical protein
MAMPAGSATSCLEAGVVSADGVRYVRTGAGLVLVPIILVAVLLASFALHTAWPALGLVAILLVNREDQWAFCYSGPSVAHSISLWGRVVWRKRYPLDKSDRASADVIEDSLLRVDRPRWFKLNLWLTGLGTELTLMRSNDADYVAQMVEALNGTIRHVCEKVPS